MVLRSSLKVTNILSNGDFTSINGWGGTSGGLIWSVSNNEGTITNLGSNAAAYKLYGIDNVLNGHRYYFTEKMLSNSSSDGIAFGTPILSGTKGHSGSGLYEKLSVISSVANQTNVEDFRILNTTRTGDISANPIKIKQALVIDISTLPLELQALSDAALKAVLDTWPWFDGTINGGQFGGRL